MQKGGASLRQKRLPGVNFHRLWRESGEVLASQSNRLTLILATMVALSPLPFYRVIWRLVRLIPVACFPGKEMLSYGIAALFILAMTLFISLPLLCGLPWMASEMERGRAVLLQDVFRSFADRRSYRAALEISFSVLWRIALLCGLEIALYQLLFFLSEGAVTVMVLGIPLYLGVFIFWYLLAMRGFLLTYFALRQPGEPMNMQPYAVSAAIHYGMGFFPWIVLSVLTLGILLLADTLPRMLIAYFRLCNQLNEITTRSEDI